MDLFFGFGLFLCPPSFDYFSPLFSSFVIHRVTPLLLSHYENLSLLSTQVQCRDSKNVAQGRSPIPVLVRAEPTRVLIGSEIHLSALHLPHLLMPTFDLVVVGSGGGPYETNLSSSVSFLSPLRKDHKSFLSVDRYLFKPCDTSWKDGIVALEAGELKFAYITSRDLEAFSPRFLQARG
jgi:hypothetical protein